MDWTAVINGHKVEIQSPEKAWRMTIDAGTGDAAKKIAEALDAAADSGELTPDEKRLREIIREVKGL